MLDNNLPLAVIKWFARASSIVTITLMAMMLVGEGFHPSEITRNQWVGLVFFPFGVVMGMVIAWWNEGVGSIVTVGSLAAFYLIYGYLLGNPVGVWFIVFACPGFLFLLHWLLTGAHPKHALTV
jgi:hypothetical protein